MAKGDLGVPPIKVKIDTKQVQNDLGNIETQIPEVGASMAYDIARNFAKRIQESIRSHGLIWTGKLLESASPANVRPITGAASKGYEIPFTGTGTPRGGSYADFLNRMKKHAVNPWKPENAPIKDWAQEKLGFVPGVLYVRKYPFMTPVLQRSAQILREYVDTKGRKKLRSFLDAMTQNI